MPAPRWIARVNKHVTNRLLGPVVIRLPGFGMLVHTGRNSGQEYRTPIAVFRKSNGFIIALTYGPETEWVRNVLAADGCRLETRSGSFELTAPHVFHDPHRQAVPSWVRVPLRFMRVADFIDLRIA